MAPRCRLVTALWLRICRLVSLGRFVKNEKKSTILKIDIFCNFRNFKVDRGRVRASARSRWSFLSRPLSWCAFCERRVFRAPLRKVGPAHAVPPYPAWSWDDYFPDCLNIFFLSFPPPFGPSFTFLFFSFSNFLLSLRRPERPHPRTSLSSRKSEGENRAR